MIDRKLVIGISIGVGVTLIACLLSFFVVTSLTGGVHNTGGSNASKAEVASVYAQYSKDMQMVDFNKIQAAYVDLANTEEEYGNTQPLKVDWQGIDKYLSPDILQDKNKAFEMLSNIIYFSPQIGVPTSNVFSADESKITISDSDVAEIPPSGQLVRASNGTVSEAKASKYNSSTKVYSVFFSKKSDSWLLDYDAMHEYYSNIS